MIKDIKHKLSGWSLPAHVDGSPGHPVQDGTEDDDLNRPTT